jgi:WD40 repeat protein
MQQTSKVKHGNRAWTVNWHPSGNSFAACGDKTISIWKLTGEVWIQTHTLEGIHQRTIRSINWSPDGLLLSSASFDGTTAIWELDGNDYECIATLEGHENEVKACSWSCSGSLLATCSRDKSVWIWDHEDDDFACLSVLQQHSADVKIVKWHPFKEILASGSYDDTIRIWIEDENTDDWKCSHVLKGHTSTVWSLDFDGDNQLASVSDDCSIKLWKYSDEEKKGQWNCISTKEKAHERTIYSVSWNKPSIIATCSADNSIAVWKIDEDIQQICRVENAHGLVDVNCVEWNPIQKNVLASAGDDGYIRIWKYTP